jgi:hypothetical protein
LRMIFVTCTHRSLNEDSYQFRPFAS